MRQRDRDEATSIQQYGLLRTLIAKHFLSKSLDEIHNSYATGTFKLRLLAAIALFSKALDRVFPKRGKARNIGEKFEMFASGEDFAEPFYQNTYVQELVKCSPSESPNHCSAN